MSHKSTNTPGDDTTCLLPRINFEFRPRRAKFQLDCSTSPVSTPSTLHSSQGLTLDRAVLAQKWTALGQISDLIRKHGSFRLVILTAISGTRTSYVPYTGSTMPGSRTMGTLKSVEENLKDDLDEIISADDPTLSHMTDPCVSYRSNRTRASNRVHKVPSSTEVMEFTPYFLADVLSDVGVTLSLFPKLWLGTLPHVYALLTRCGVYTRRLQVQRQNVCWG
jgi:hypothetical protein